MDKKFLKAALALAAVFLTACSEAPKPAPKETKAETETKKEPPQATEPVAAKTAFYEMYTPAHTWAADLLAISVVSNDVPGVTPEPGKSAMWTAIFVSPSRQESRTFSYSVADHGDTHKGVAVGNALPWGGATPKAKPFQTSEFVVNSDAACQTALEKAGPWVKKHPGTSPSLALGAASRFPAPVWYILWGTAKSGYAVYVNATTGTVITK